PGCSLAASVTFSGVQGGPHTTSTLAFVTPGTARTLASTSGGSDPATGQAGDVSVMRIPTSPFCSSTVTSYASPTSQVLPGTSGSYQLCRASPTLSRMPAADPRRGG